VSFRFRYVLGTSAHPLVTLDGRFSRPRPIIPVTILGPADQWIGDCILDSGSDDTVFAETVATKIGIDLTQAPTGSASVVGGGTIPLRYAMVTLRIADKSDAKIWQCWVGFAPVQLQRPLLGFAGVLRYFTAIFHGDREEVELAVNGLYPGT
jgi:hypothetical protein